MPCELCLDPDGIPCFPVYGLGPHSHRDGPVSGNAVLNEVQEAEAYQEDPDTPGCGVYWCPYCGDGKPEQAAVMQQPARAVDQHGIPL